MDDWEDAYPVNLTYPMPIAGRQWKKVASNYCPDVGAGKKTGYAGILSRYYGRYTGYGGSIYFKYDDKYFYGFLDIKDSSVFGMEQGRIDPVCGLVDYGDSQIIMFDIDNYFKDFMSKEEIFHERDVLRPEFVPSLLPHRNNQIQKIAEIVACSLKNSMPSNIFIFARDIYSFKDFV